MQMNDGVAIFQKYSIFSINSIFSITRGVRAVWFHFGTDFGTLHYSIQVALSTSDTLPAVAASCSMKRPQPALPLNIEKILIWQQVNLAVF